VPDGSGGCFGKAASKKAAQRPRAFEPVRKRQPVPGVAEDVEFGVGQSGMKLRRGGYRNERAAV
jgi:hypothetical protein